MKGHSIDERIERLYLKEDEVGIQPWDDNSLKLAVEASLGGLASETAVSNAVLWPQRGVDGENINPDKQLQNLSSELWAKVLDLLKPTLVICCGKIAKNVIANTGWSGETLSLRLPSPSVLSRVSGMFDENDLLVRYPEVARVIKKHPEWIEGYKKNKILFACHAVSLCGGTKVRKKK